MCVHACVHDHDACAHNVVYWHQIIPVRISYSLHSSLKAPIHIKTQQHQRFHLSGTGSPEVEVEVGLR